jgi:uncharacterized delta-60 repeat protein
MSRIVFNGAARAACAFVVALAISAPSRAADGPCKNHYILTSDDPCLSAPGSLDPRFGDAGFAPLQSEFATATATVRRDGKILIAGTARSESAGGPQDRFALVQLGPDGAVDDTFGNAGTVRTPLFPDVELLGLAIQPDGKVVAGGRKWLYRDSDWNQSSSAFVVARYLADGQPDPGFGLGGLVVMPIGWTASAETPLVQPDGRILVKGETCDTGRTRCTPIVARYNADGTLDTRYGAEGIVYYPSYSSGRPALQADGKLVDTLFYKVGPIQSRRCTEERCVCTGYSGETWSCHWPTIQEQAASRASALVRFNTDGTLDKSFGVEGTRSIPFDARLTLPTQDGRIVIAGSALIADPEHNWLTLARYDADGSLDQTFGVGGIATDRFTGGLHVQRWFLDWPSGLQQQPDGKLIVTASRGDTFDWSGILIVRYTADGRLDPSFGGRGYVHTVKTTLDFAGNLQLQPDGKVIVVASIWGQGNGLLRYRGDEVVEFRNGLTGHYFLTVSPEEQIGIGLGLSGPGWMTTGETFKSNARRSACRFAGRPGLGPNSHFFTIDADECARVGQDPGWRFEGFDFSASPLSSGTCGSGETPVYRLYNNGFERRDSNHRYTTDKAVRDGMVAAGWSGEGAVFCVPQ